MWFFSLWFRISIYNELLYTYLRSDPSIVLPCVRTLKSHWIRWWSLLSAVPTASSRRHLRRSCLFHAAYVYRTRYSRDSSPVTEIHVFIIKKKKSFFLKYYQTLLLYKQYNNIEFYACATPRCPQFHIVFYNRDAHIYRVYNRYIHTSRKIRRRGSQEHYSENQSHVMYALPLF